jgi:hypothetical protein
MDFPETGRVVTMGFIKLINGPEAVELMKDCPAFMLLTQIALRARREAGIVYQNGIQISLEPSQAFIGDYQNIGLTEQQYRTAKAKLASRQFATFKATNKGTIATLINTGVFDINIQDGNGQANNQATDKQRLTRKIKKEKNIYSINSPVWIDNPTLKINGLPDEYIETVKHWLNTAPDTFLTDLATDFQEINIEDETQRALDWIKDNPDKRPKIIKRFFSNWYKKAVSYAR